MATAVLEDSIDSPTTTAVIDSKNAELIAQSLNLLLRENSDSCSTESMLKRGKALALTSLVQLSLSRPYEAFDPCLAGDLEREAITYSIEHFYVSEQRIRDSYSHLPLADQQLDLCRVINDRVAELEDRRSAISRLTCARPPEKSQYLALREDISTFIQSLVDPSRVQRLFGGGEGEDVDERSRLAHQHEQELWCDNVNAFIERTNAKYPHYADILGPVELSLRGIQYGIGLMSSARTREAVEEAESLVTGLLSIPDSNASFADDQSINGVLETVHRDAPDTERRARAILNDRLRLLALRTDAVRTSLEHATSFEQRAALRDEFDRVARQVWRAWVDTIEEEKRRREEEEALFEVKARAMSNKEELEFQRELASMFPQVGDFDDLCLEEDDDIAEGAGTCVTGEKFETNKPIIERKDVSAMVLDAVYGAFVELNGDGHRRAQLGGDHRPCPRSTTASRFSMGVDMVSRLRGALSSAVDGASAPGFLFALSREWHALTARPDGTIDRVDMYVHNIEEASRIQKPVELILGRLDQLLDEWPDHPILDQLRKIGTRLLDMPLDSPLKSYATGIELLLNKSQVWEETAAKHVTLDELLKPLVSIAAHWRKLELNAWRDMLLKARRDISKEAREAWFFLFGIINCEEDLELPEFINVMDAFVQGSPVGQYAERLALLTMFGSHGMGVEVDDGFGNCSEVSRKKTMSKMLGNLARYYGQFQPAIDERIADDLKPLEKELADFVKLAKWEDRGFYAMKASAEKAHSQLCKIIRKAKEALGTPASACLRVVANGIGIAPLDGKKNISMGVRSSATKQRLASLEAQMAGFVEAIHVPPARLLGDRSHQLLGKYSQKVERISSTFQRMVKSKDEGLEGLRDAASTADGLATAAIKQAVALKNDVSKVRVVVNISSHYHRCCWERVMAGGWQEEVSAMPRSAASVTTELTSSQLTTHDSKFMKIPTGCQVEKEKGLGGLLQGVGGVWHKQAADGCR